MIIEKICEGCKQPFKIPYKQRNKLYCDRSCYFTYSNKMGKKKDNSCREERICLECGKSFTLRKKEKKKICSEACRAKWASKPENIAFVASKTKEAIQKKYGVDSLFELESFQKKCKDGMVKKYGVTTPMHDVNISQKQKCTNRNKYINTILIPKLKEHNLEIIDDYYTNKIGTKSIQYKFKCLRCGNEFKSTVLGSGLMPICRICRPISKYSAIARIIYKFLEENNIMFVQNARKIIPPQEIDFYLSDYNLAIEVDGNYWHSEIHGTKNRNYHLEKTKKTYEKNIKLIHIFGDELLLKQDIVFSRLKHTLGLTINKINGRECEIKEISATEKEEFMTRNHIQADTFSKINIGLFYDNQIVSAISFGKPRLALRQKQKFNEYELIRFANKINHQIVGGFSKLLKYFIKTYQPEKIISYADIRWSGLEKNNVYSKNGFKFAGITPPTYWYTKPKEHLKRYHRFNFRKDKLIREGFDANKTEWEIMQNRGFDRIWDCGNTKWEWCSKDFQLEF